jgi:hypothetical protein
MDCHEEGSLNYISNYFCRIVSKICNLKRVLGFFLNTGWCIVNKKAAMWRQNVYPWDLYHTAFTDVKIWREKEDKLQCFSRKWVSYWHVNVVYEVLEKQEVERKYECLWGRVNKERLRPWRYWSSTQVWIIAFWREKSNLSEFKLAIRAISKVNVCRFQHRKCRFLIKLVDTKN